jgi:ketosteroid isomerase-like protein
VFVFTRMDGTSFRMEELALQRLRGERIVEERFYYDPAQLRPLKPTSPA